VPLLGLQYNGSAFAKILPAREKPAAPSRFQLLNPVQLLQVPRFQLRNSFQLLLLLAKYALHFGPQFFFNYFGLCC
jgi:hypothetical protein